MAATAASAAFVAAVVLAAAVALAMLLPRDGGPWLSRYSDRGVLRDVLQRRTHEDPAAEFGKLARLMRRGKSDAAARVAARMARLARAQLGVGHRRTWHGDGRDRVQARHVKVDVRAGEDVVVVRKAGATIVYADRGKARTRNGAA